MFQGTLFSEQKKPAEKLVNKKKVLLAFEQGTGKTVISLASAEKLFELNKAKRALVLIPADIDWQWEDRLNQFVDSDFILAQSGSTKKKKATRDYSQEVRYHLVSYPIFLNDYNFIAEQPWDIVIADEAEAFANNKSKTAKFIKSLNTEVDPTYRWALTGTAIGNRLEELYSIFYWVDKTFLPPWPAFEKMHVVRSQKTKAIIRYKNLKPLHKHLTHRMDRLQRHELQGKLPELISKFYHIEPSKEYLEAQQDMLGVLNDMVEEIDLNHFVYWGTKSKVGKGFSDLRQKLISDAKLKYAIKLLKKITSENEGNKVVIFSFFKNPIYKLEELLALDMIPFSVYTGDQNSEQKRSAVKHFENAGRVMICSDAGARGLDLPFANHLIHLDVPFSFATQDQRNKRIRRRTSTSKIALVNYLIMQDSIEEYYFNITQAKGRLASGALEGTEDKVTVKPQSLRQFIRNIQ